MKRTITDIAVVGLLCALAAPAAAGDYTFKLIADSEGAHGYTFTAFPGRPAVNDNGLVAFRADMAGPTSGVYTGDGANITKLLDTNDSVDSERVDNLGDYVSINNSGVTAFIAAGGERNRILTASASSAAELYDSNDENFFDFYDCPDINNNGMVGFMATLNNDDYGIFRGDGGTSVQIEIGTPSMFVATPMINDNNYAAWYADHGGLYINNGTSTSLVASQVDYPAATFGNPINSQNVAAFTAGPCPAEGGASDGVHTASIGGGVTTVVNSNGPFASFGNAGIAYNETDGQLLAFAAELDIDGEGELVSGLYTGANPVADKVIETGDMLFGQTVETLVFYGEGLNNAGQIAFLAHLGDGQGGEGRGVIVLATPVPEPASVLLLTAGAGLLLLRRRRNRVRAQTHPKKKNIECQTRNVEF